MIPPRDDYVLVLRRVPHNRGILVSELVALVEADLEVCHDQLTPPPVGEAPLFGWSREGVRAFVSKLVQQDFLRGTFWADGRPAYVTLVERTKTELDAQPGIKSRALELRMSSKGLLEQIAREADE